MNKRRVDHVPRTLAAARVEFQMRAQPTIRTDPAPIMPGTAGGDPITLRGIPVVGGCSGAIPGTIPHHSVR